MRHFVIDKTWYGGKLPYKKKEIDIDNNITMLVGCNGSGKSTLLNQIQASLEKQNIACLMCDIQLLNADIVESMVSSEGEQVVMKLGQFAKQLGRFTTTNNDKTEQWVLLDASDSGLSIDNIISLKKLLHMVVRTTPVPLYILVTTNSYEMVCDENCFDVVGCKYIRFENYDEYREYILKTRAIKDIK